ncbi:MAG: 4'-phosphopantetheinyl transferase superfamily protein [Chlamydiota bacterium]
MSVYQGICLVEIERVKAAAERFGGRFLDRVFARGELDYCGEGAARPQRLAARFAAKAAVRAALRQAGLPAPPYRALEVERDEWGMPYLKLLKGVMNGVRILLSISHTRTLAAACAAVVKDGGD